MAMSSYLDVDDILMEEEPVSVTFRTDAAGVGILDPGAEHNNIEAGAKIELPFWLAQELSYAQAVTINPPSCYNQKIRKEMKADPGCVDLKSRCPYFYELGCKIAPLTADATIGSFLFSTLQGRYKELLSKSHTKGIRAKPKFLSQLTREETKLFEAGNESMKAFRKWRVEGTRLEKAAVLGKKRRNLPEETATI